MSYYWQKSGTSSSGTPGQAAAKSTESEVQQAVEDVASNAEKLVNAAEQTGSGESISTRGSRFSDYLQLLSEGVKFLKETLAGVNWEELAKDSKERTQAYVKDLIEHACLLNHPQSSSRKMYRRKSSS
jgi:hypothetical protein